MNTNKGDDVMANKTTIIIKNDKDFDGYVIGIFEQNDGTFQALTATKSKSFKTLAGAKRFMINLGYKVA